MSAPPITGSPTSSKSTSLEEKDKKFSSKRSSEYYDPCQEAANKSIRCMNRNNGDKDMCQDYFQAYRDCKKEWMQRLKESKKTEGGGWFS